MLSSIALNYLKNKQTCDQNKLTQNIDINFSRRGRTLENINMHELDF